MKNIILLLITALSMLSAQAQKPEIIQSFARIQHPMSWYKDQSKAWQQRINENSGDQTAWFNYFKANRVVIFHDTTDHRNEEERDAVLKDIVDRMEKAIPNSYEYNFCRWQLGGNDMKYYSFLEKAVAIDPDRTEHTDYMINIGELERNISQRDEYSLKLFNTNQMSTGMMYYNYNSLIGLDKDAILLTGGDNDTYPAWLLQAKGIRRDIKVINLYLLHIKDYREKIFNELGIEALDIDPDINPRQFKEKIVEAMSKNKNKFPVCLALTAASCDSYTDSIENDLYLIGLSYIYSKQPIDNIAFLKKNIEQLYALDYIDKPFYNDIAAEQVKSVNSNYLVPMIKLYQHYKTSGDLAKQKWMKEKLILISKDSDQEEETLKYLD